jgi:hypothetical protein
MANALQQNLLRERCKAMIPSISKMVEETGNAHIHQYRPDGITHECAGAIQSSIPTSAKIESNKTPVETQWHFFIT